MIRFFFSKINISGVVKVVRWPLWISINSNFTTDEVMPHKISPGPMNSTSKELF